MKLAIKNQQFVTSLDELKNIDTTNISDQFLVLVDNENSSFIYFQNAQKGITPNTGSGKWQKDKFAKLIYVVNENYDFALNQALELNIDLYFNTKLWRWGDYELTFNDYNYLMNLLNWDDFQKITSNFLNNLSHITPHIISIDELTILPNSNVTLEIIAEHFDNTTWVYIPNFDGYINDVILVNSNTIQLDLSIGSTINNYNLILFNGYNRSDTWPINNGLKKLKVTNILPTGPEKFLRTSNSIGNFYLGNAFSSSSFNFELNPSKAFDGDEGTRHYSDKNQSLNHILGIRMLNPTLITKISYRGDFGSNTFKLEGSNNTITGLDGDWDDLGNYEIKNKFVKIKEEYVYTSFRIIWIEPDDSEFANVKELRIKGRQ